MLLAHILNKLTLNTPSRLLPHLPPPAPLYSHTFAKAPGVTGEGREVRKWLWGFHPAGAGCGQLVQKKEMPYICLFLFSLKYLAIKKKQKYILTEAFLRALRE